MACQRTDRQRMDGVAFWLTIAALAAIACALLVWPAVGDACIHAYHGGADPFWPLMLVGPGVMLAVTIVGLAVLVLGAVRRAWTAVCAGLFALATGLVLTYVMGVITLTACCG